MSTIERIRKLRTNRLGHHYDLLREAGACDASGNGRELSAILRTLGLSRGSAELSAQFCGTMAGRCSVDVRVCFKRRQLPDMSRNWTCPREEVTASSCHVQENQTRRRQNQIGSASFLSSTW